MNTHKSIEDLIKRLEWKADAIAMGERITWGSDSEIMREAAEALRRSQQQVQEAVEELKRDVLGGLFARCNELRLEIESQEEEHGLADTSTIDRLSEAEKTYSDFKKGFEASTLQSKRLEDKKEV